MDQILTLISGYSDYRVSLEKQALRHICSCLYYDLADSIDAASDQELVDYIEGRYDCEMCGHRNSQDM